MTRPEALSGNKSLLLSQLTLFMAFGMALALLGSCKKNPYPQGEVLYRYHCENCHMADGSGLVRLIPHLDSSKLTLSDPAKLVCLIRLGLPKNPETGQEMPPNNDLSEVELTNLINFLGFRYGDDPQTVMVDEVKKMLAGCQSVESGR